MENTRQVLVACRVTPGMFDNEYAVEISLPTGEKVSLFADRTLVETIEGKTFLRVNTVEENGVQNEGPVLLPSESFEKGSRWLRLPKSQLQPA